MTRTLLLLSLFFLRQGIYAQSSSLETLALNVPPSNTGSTAQMMEYIKQNFTTDSDRVRAIYVWVTNNIKYDVERLKMMDRDPNMLPQATGNVLISRKAVCQGYADLFVELCNGVGVKANVVAGYTKRQGIVSSIGHAWAAVQLYNTWYLFDPTWGAGYVKDDQFVKSFNNKFYKVQPSELIQDHMPFDPMYQFMNNTVSNKEFIEGITVAGNKPYFNYVDTLRQFDLLSKQEKLYSQERRITANGVRNDLIARELGYIKKSLQAYASNDNSSEAGNDFMRANSLFNEYFDNKSKRFSSIDDNALRQLVDSISYYAKHCRTLLSTLVPKTDAQRNAIANNNQNLERLQNRLAEERNFVDKYLAADKNARLQMFGRRN